MRHLCSLHKLTSLSYGYANVLAGRTPQSFAEDVIRHARTANLVDPLNQMQMIWDRLEPNFQRDVPIPKDTLTLGQLLKILEKKQFWENVNAQYHERRNYRGFRGNTGPNRNSSTPGASHSHRNSLC